MAIKTPVPNWLSSKEAAALMGVSEAWLTLARDGKFPGPPFTRYNSRFQYREDYVLAFIDARTASISTIHLQAIA